MQFYFITSEIETFQSCLQIIIINTIRGVQKKKPHIIIHLVFPKRNWSALFIHHPPEGFKAAWDTANITITAIHHHLLHDKLTPDAAVPNILAHHIVLQVLVLKVVAPTHPKHNLIREWCLGTYNLGVKILVVIIEDLLHDILHYLGDGQVVLHHNQVLNPGHHKVAGLRYQKAEGTNLEHKLHKKLNNEQLHQPDHGHSFGLPPWPPVWFSSRFSYNHGKTHPPPEVSESCQVTPTSLSRYDTITTKMLPRTTKPEETRHTDHTLHLTLWGTSLSMGEPFWGSDNTSMILLKAQS